MKFLEARECQRELRGALEINRRVICVVFLLAALLSLPISPALAQDALLRDAQIEGSVRDSAGKAVVGAFVRLQEKSGTNSAETKTDAHGEFAFSALSAGTYSVKLEKSGFRGASEDSIKVGPAEKKHCKFVLRTPEESSALSSAAASSASSAIQLDDRPNFTVAGVTDSSGSGGHGSETRLRTGEALARETLKLQADESSPAANARGVGDETVLRAAVLQSPRGFEENHRLGEFYFHAGRYREAVPFLKIACQVNPADHSNALDLALALKADGEFAQAREQVNQMLADEKELGKTNEANLRRVLGDLEEKMDDPLGAEREYERASGLDASEQNYFLWGTELLLHRAAAPAIEVFSRGVHLHPGSARMLAGLGASLYASGSAEEASQRLCEASDLDPANSAPYLFLGKMQEAASAPLPCAEQRLAHFVRDQPASALANYYYAVALWKRDRATENPDTMKLAETMFEKSSAIDPTFDSAYLQLGNLYFARGALPEALAAYKKAVAANSASSEAHYRLGLTYKRIGDEGKARDEFEEYKRLDRTEAAAEERQRRELRQFLFILKDQTVGDQKQSAAH